LGNLFTDIAEECGIGVISVIATTSHDTASAVVSVPAMEKQFIYISCGTWSLMGVEVDQPVINQKSYSLSFSNEGGVDNKIRLLKMIMGLWLIQECKRQWAREGKIFNFAELESIAMVAEPFKSFINPDDSAFMPPGDMPGRIARYCRETRQPVPENAGEIVRCIAQSLALKYRMTVENLEDLLGNELPVIHMVGGGIKDKMLCRFTANATGRTVFAGPVEATSVGNLMVQARALGEVKNLKEIRQVVKESFPEETYRPQDAEQWNEAYYRFRKIIEIHK
jgi:sugar (pentulose or hexulose) kinase